VLNVYLQQYDCRKIFLFVSCIMYCCQGRFFTLFTSCFFRCPSWCDRVLIDKELNNQTQVGMLVFLIDYSTDSRQTSFKILFQNAMFVAFQQSIFRLLLDRETSLNEIYYFTIIQWESLLVYRRVSMFTFLVAKLYYYRQYLCVRNFITFIPFPHTFRRKN